ncbi:P-loop containing nucleoside triphosphate hydrolase protein [Xylariales sp. AK1849]|nr:P-loop containing nucleoside triphosphate hydrolase protein [Xylariales sp. AK1849]
MDLLKLLSRGAKKTSKAKAPAPASKPTNPQLYHDPTRGVKRKRNDEALDIASKDGVVDVDFFASSDKKNSVHARNLEKIASPVAATNDAGTQLLDEDEVRQVLRSHRLKFMILSKREDAKSKVKKKKKAQANLKAKDSKYPVFPQPLTSFALLSTYKVSPRLLGNIAKQGYRLPTEVQLGSLPLLLDPATALQGVSDDDINITSDSGVNFLAIAPTGSGKTLAFLIPTIHAILRRRADQTRQDDHVLDAIVLAPTRELAHQIVNEGRKLAAGTGVKVALFKKGMKLPTEDVHSEVADSSILTDDEYGDEAISTNSDDGDEDADDDHGNGTITKTDILVTTPLLLLNFLTNIRTTRRTLPTVRSIILDEADVLLDKLFRDQILGIWSSCTHGSLHLSCWSATMGSSIEDLLMDQLHARGNDGSNAPLFRLVVGLRDSAVPRIDHHLIYTGDQEKGKLYTLRQLLHPSSSNDSLPDMGLPFIVFVQTIERAVSLHDELKFEFPAEAGGSSRIASLHSSLSESARSSIISRFRAGEVWLLITTDLLMRGIDLRGINAVINYDVPTSSAAYVHRVGRTARAGGQGVAATFFTKEDVPYLKSIANVVSLSSNQAGKSGDESVPKWLMDALPKVRKEDKQKLKKHGVESRRGNKAQITTKSAWEKKRENNRQGAIAGSKKRKTEEQGVKSGDEWAGIDD